MGEATKLEAFRYKKSQKPQVLRASELRNPWAKKDPDVSVSITVMRKEPAAVGWFASLFTPWYRYPIDEIGSNYTKFMITVVRAEWNENGYPVSPGHLWYEVYNIYSAADHIRHEMHHARGNGVAEVHYRPVELEKEFKPFFE